VTALLADPSATLKTPAKDDIAARVTAQLQRDYPPGALSWISGLSWTGPVQVPVTQIDRTHGDTDWQAAAADKAKLQVMRKRIGAGWKKPVILVRAKGAARLFAVDGHSRVLSCEALGLPVTAYIGTASAAHGGWEVAHDRQLANDSGSVIELVGPKGYIHGWIRPGGPPARSTATPATLGQLAVVHRQSTAYTDAKFAEQAAQIAVLHKRMAEMSDSKESRNAKLKIASHIGVAAGGAILSYALTKGGAPDIVGVATGFLSIGSQEAIDYVKKL
jgi:hypothetical protein